MTSKFILFEIYTRQKRKGRPKAKTKVEKLEAIWSNRFGGYEENEQHMQAVIDSAASGKWLLLTYYPMP